MFHYIHEGELLIWSWRVLRPIKTILHYYCNAIPSALGLFGMLLSKSVYILAQLLERKQDSSSMEYEVSMKQVSGKTNQFSRYVAQSVGWINRRMGRQQTNLGLQNIPCMLIRRTWVVLYSTCQKIHRDKLHNLWACRSAISGEYPSVIGSGDAGVQEV